jgi:hypothetical protein
VSETSFSYEVKAGIALPYTKYHIKHLNRVKKALKDLQIKIFWVTYDGIIEE